MKNWKLVIEYDGTEFAGWQIQPGRATVQGALAGAIAQMSGDEVIVHGAGRTDAGVHAEAQVASFRTRSRIGAVNWLRGLNSLTPEGLSVRSVEEVAEDFDASRSARGKVYRYELRMGDAPPALERKRSWWYRWDLDVAAMKAAARTFLGRHDYRAFQGADSPRKTTVRSVFLVDVQDAPGRVSIRVGGGGFLYRMVRNIVGTLVEVGAGKRRGDSIAALLMGTERRLAGPTAPPEGLYLERVIY